MSTPNLTPTGQTYRDLNKNGRMDTYEDPRAPISERVEDLLSQMTLAEKAGLMFHTVLPVGQDGQLVEEHGMYHPLTTSDVVIGRGMNHFNIHQIPSPRLTAEWHNRLQALAESTRLGIPVTISSDPRHGFTNSMGATVRTQYFSLWPEPIGLAAAGEETVREFAAVARQEYLAVGIRLCLHPMADLATEPRWSRVSGTFGEDAHLAARLVDAYVRGFQGESLGTNSVACMVKHFPGGGPQKEGWDPHFSHGKEQVYPGGNFDYHLLPFEAAFEAGAAQVMPYYGQPVGLPIESVGFGFNKDVITGLLREKYGFDGVVCTDWTLIYPIEFNGQIFMEARAWGVEHLTPAERMLKCLDAGVDQFGGEACPDLIVELVQAGKVPAARIDQSARRLLRDKFRLGLFDNPYVDPDAAERIVGQAEFKAAGERAQRRSLVLLKNGSPAGEPVLPLRERPKVYLEGVDPSAAAARYADPVEQPEQADFAILRLRTPYRPREGATGYAAMVREGDLDFTGAEKERLLDLIARVPTIVEINLERPAVIPEIAAGCAALVAGFGASDTVLFDLLWGRFEPSGKLPFELPSSMDAVRRQKEDLPYDSEEPLYPFGFGLEHL